MNEQEVRMIDITNPEEVEVVLRQDRRVLWVNIDGVCRLRVSLQTREGRLPLQLKIAGVCLGSDETI